jgi:adenine deaminase
VKLIDPVEGRVTENTTITVSGGIFMEVSIGQPPHDGIQSIDLGGKYVCPGLIDDHVHVTAGLRSGVSFQGIRVAEDLELL